MKFVMLIQESESDFRQRESSPDGAYWSAWKAYSRALGEAGVLVGGHALGAPHTGTTIRVVEGKRRVQDGPFADTKEQLGGFMVFECPSLDAALEWAARCPAATTGAVELRPVLPMME